MKINTLTTAEETLMQLLWELNVFYLKDVMTQHPEPKPHQNTISTYLKILVDKSFLKTEKQGRIFKYSVAVPRESYVDFLLKTMAKNYFNDSPQEMNDYIARAFKLQKEEVKEDKPVQKPTPVKKTVVQKVVEVEPIVTDPVSELVEEILLDKKAKKAKKKDKEKKDKDKDKSKEKKKKK